MLVLFTLGCEDDDDPVIENPEEVITNITLTLTPSGGGGGGAPVILAFSDPDGDGGTDPTLLVSGPLAANATYSGSLTLTNASNPSAVEDITAEVRAEDEEHQAFYIVGGGANLTATYTGTPDANGDPVGLETEMTTGAASSGTLRIVLLHEPNKGASGLNIGNPDPAGGESDVDIRFDITIQ